MTWPPTTTLTAAQLVAVAPRLRPEAVGCASAHAGDSIPAFAVAYVESVACLAGSAGWPPDAIDAEIATAAECMGIALDADALAHLHRCAREADPGLAVDWSWPMRRRR